MRQPWDSSPTDELDRGLIEAHHQSARVGDFAIEIEHIFHPRNVLGIDAGTAPHLALHELLPWNRKALRHQTLTA